MSARLTGKVAVVTGAGSSGPGVGSGKATSILLARSGAEVVLVDRNEAAARETLDLIKAENGEAQIFVGDVTNAEVCAAAIAFAVETYGKITTLVNNVAIVQIADLLACDEDHWSQILETNLKSAMLMTGAAVRQMKLVGGGSIVNIASTVALRGYPSLTAYTASKGGLLALTGSWAVEQGRNNIRVNCICPGSMHTPMAVKLLGSDLTEKKRIFRASMTPLGIEGTGWDVGWAAVFLASDEARWITGVTLPVDGGETIATPQWGAAMAAEKVQAD